MASAFQTRYKYSTGRPFTRTERNVTTGTRVRYSPTGFYLSVRFRGASVIWLSANIRGRRSRSWTFLWSLYSRLILKLISTNTHHRVNDAGVASRSERLKTAARLENGHDTGENGGSFSSKHAAAKHHSPTTMRFPKTKITFTLLWFFFLIRRYYVTGMGRGERNVCVDLLRRLRLFEYLWRRQYEPLNNVICSYVPIHVFELISPSRTSTVRILSPSFYRKPYTFLTI